MGGVMKDFFIIENTQRRELILSIVDGNDNILLFDTFKEAKMVAEDQSLCQAFGYEIFQRGTGRVK